MKELVLIVSYLLLGLPCFATCIVIGRNKTDLFIGADGKLNRINNTNTHETICKILREGKFYFAFSGLGTPGLLAIARSACQRSRNSVDLETNFKSGAEAEIKTYMDNIRRDFPDNYRFFDQQQYIIKFSFCYYENALPKITTFYFSVKNTSPTETAIFCTKRDDQNFIILGEDDISKMPIAEKNKLQKTFLTKQIDAIKYVIKYEAKLHPELVSEPITVVRITRLGATWYPSVNPCNK